jgi:DnaJ-class molecular chaperone
MNSVFQFVVREFEKRRSASHEQINITVQCTLEQLFTGHSAQVQFVENGSCEERQESVTISPGSGKDTVIQWDVERGDYARSHRMLRLVVAIEELPHPIFTRAGADLIVDVTISVGEALLGVNRELVGIDNEVIPIVEPGVIRPGTKRKLRGKGMPRSSGFSRGDLVVRFKIEFPSELSPEEKDIIRSLASSKR